MIPPYFENNWHLASHKAINRAYDHIRTAIENKHNSVLYESAFAPEIKTYIESVSGGIV